MDRTLSLARPRAAPPRGLLARGLALMAIGRSRRGLARLDDRLLADVGLTREEALIEAARPAWEGLDGHPWNAPAHWLR